MRNVSCLLVLKLPVTGFKTKRSGEYPDRLCLRKKGCDTVLCQIASEKNEKDAGLIEKSGLLERATCW